MTPQKILQELFAGGVLMLLDGLVSNLVITIGMTKPQAEQAALEALQAAAKLYKEG